ncbi:MAG: Rrf2 family transcriptional regulator [Bacteroidota bacterium]
MILSRACTYGIQAVVYTATQNPNGYVSIAEAARELNIPFYFLTKVLQTLTDNKLLLSKRGANGGIMLAKKSADISLLDIIAAIDGLGVFQECILGLPGCGHASPCPIHQYWSGQREKLREHFSKTTLADVAQNVRERAFRIASIEDIKTNILNIEV